jgi:hypothetical protein
MMEHQKEYIEMSNKKRQLMEEQASRVEEEKLNIKK